MALFILPMIDLESLKQEYLDQIAPIQQRRAQLQRQLPGLRGEPYFAMLRRIDGLYMAEQNLLDGAREILKSVGRGR